MKNCPKMIDAGRREFLSGAGLAAASVAAATVVPSSAESAPASARVECVQIGGIRGELKSPTAL
jgi:arsenite oxidase small subunit